MEMLHRFFGIWGGALAFTCFSCAHVFFQSFFLHRYAAHKMYYMHPLVEKFVHFMAFVVMGSSYLMPKGYAFLHRAHHAHSDGPLDPHAPEHYRDPFMMMIDTRHRYHQLCTGKVQPEARFLKPAFPEWPLIDRIGNSYPGRITWIAIYIWLFSIFATSIWQWVIFLPPIIFMGAIHGAIVNWCGHKYGYRNHNLDDKSRNFVLVTDPVTMGELFQNNHHKYSNRANFANRWFEFDLTYLIMWILDLLHIIRIDRPKKTQFPKAA